MPVVEILAVIWGFLWLAQSTYQLIQDRKMRNSEIIYERMERKQENLIQIQKSREGADGKNLPALLLPPNLNQKGIRRKRRERRKGKEGK